MKNIIIVLTIIFILIGLAEVKTYNKEIDESIKAINETAQACTVDMRKDINLICD